MSSSEKEQWTKLLSSKRFGRESSEGNDDNSDRNEFERDFDRIIFSSAFRRLKDKTQVFPLSSNDFVRTRLTHSLEVASVGRSLGRKLTLHLRKQNTLPDSNPSIASIVSAACLAHDIGNPPFGHSGEAAIQAWAKRSISHENPKKNSICHVQCEQELKDFELFEGNAQGLRVITELQERRRDGGMQLTQATLGAMLKYPCNSLIGHKKNGDIARKKFGYFRSEQDDVSATIRNLGILEDCDGGFRRHPLSFLVEAADDICYAIIDLEDSVDQNVIDLETAIDLLEPIAEIGGANLSKSYTGKERAGWLRACAIHGLQEECWRVFMENLPNILDGKLLNGLIDISKAESDYKAVIEKISEKAYQSARVLQVEAAGFQVIGGLLDLFVPALLGDKDFPLTKQICGLFPQGYIATPWEQIDTLSRYERILAATDYVSGMTDSFAVDLYQKLLGIKLPE